MSSDHLRKIEKTIERLYKLFMGLCEEHDLNPYSPEKQNAKVVRRQKTFILEVNWNSSDGNVYALCGPIRDGRDDDTVMIGIDRLHFVGVGSIMKGRSEDQRVESFVIDLVNSLHEQLESRFSEREKAAIGYLADRIFGDMVRQP